MDDILYFISVFFKHIFARSMCYFNNQRMVALNKIGQNEDNFSIVNEQLHTNC